ncbi:MAG: hypothetical protein IJ390_04600 [Lachnospiraceae bacterium]|nr:hypothetical protein [Lachnospiraceae bacterium]
MANLIAFLNSFLSYLLLFAVCVAVILIAVKLGIMLRKNKDAKTALEAAEATDQELTEKKA